MKVTRKMIFELGPDELDNIEELVIVLNPGNGVNKVTLNFDSDFNLISDQPLLLAVKTRRQYKRRKTENEVSQAITTTNPEESVVEIAEEIVDEKTKETIDETFIEAIIAKDSDFLLPVSACEKDFAFRNTRIIPYTMDVTHDSLESFMAKFIYNKNSRKSFEEKIYGFFLEDMLGVKFNFKLVSAWHAGLWMVMDPYGFRDACGGKVTYRVIEFAFNKIRKQLEERIIHIHGHLPKPVKPIIEDKRKTRFKKAS
ncbi:MAG: hypothetical protein ACOYL8_02140 [Patescibacteria group bacterium]